jgi:hypothetical protein
MGQFGLFAAKKIPPRTHLLDYLGEIHCDDRPSSDYDLSLYRTPDGSVSVGVDASGMGNEGRFVNDYRGIRAKPNAQFEERRADNGELRMSIWVGSEAVKKGEEILVSGWVQLNALFLTVIGVAPVGELRQIVVESPATTRAVIAVVNVACWGVQSLDLQAEVCGSSSEATEGNGFVGDGSAQTRPNTGRSCRRLTTLTVTIFRSLLRTPACTFSSLRS